MTERERAKEVICTLIEVAGNNMDGKYRLVKGFYHAHLEYARVTQGMDLTDHPIVNLPDGPCIDEHEQILDELVEEGRITVSYRPIPGKHAAHMYTLLKPSVLFAKESREYSAVESGYNKVKGKSRDQLKAESHQRSWDLTTTGKEQNIQLDLMSEEEYQEYKAASQEIDRLFAGVK